MTFRALPEQFGAAVYVFRGEAAPSPLPGDLLHLLDSAFSFVTEAPGQPGIIAESVRAVHISYQTAVNFVANVA